MALFKDFFSPSRSTKDTVPDPLQERASRSNGPRTLPVPMNLEERMAFRRELLFETIRDSLTKRFIAADSYRVKVMRTDKRGHCFVVMLDMSSAFMASDAGQHAQLAETAALLVKNAETRYDLMVGGVYWRIDETLGASAATWVRPSLPLPLQPPGASIEKYVRLGGDPMTDFEEDWQKDSDTQLSDRTYSSDMTQLIAESQKQPAQEATQQPSQEPSPEPLPEQSPKPSQEPSQEPSPKPTQEPPQK